MCRSRGLRLGRAIRRCHPRNASRAESFREVRQGALARSVRLLLRTRGHTRPYRAARAGRSGRVAESRARVPTLQRGEGREAVADVSVSALWWNLARAASEGARGDRMTP